MEKVLIRFLAVVLGLFVAAELVDGVSISGLYSAMLVALVLGVTNLIVRPVLIVLTLPITIVTLGFFLFILNAVLFLSIGTMVKGFEVDGFVPALLGSIIVSIVSWVVQKIT
jgi:putative membrane protein